VSQKKFGIVGGGLLGMTLAHGLAKSGHRVTIFEAAPSFGGLASAWRIGDATWDRYYHVALQSDQALRSLLNELSLEQDLQWRKTRTGFYYQGRLYEIGTPSDYLRLPALTLYEKFRLGVSILYASRVQDWQKLSSLSVEQWLTRIGGRRVFDKFWRPLVIAKLGEDYRTTSATFIWATIKRLYAARRSGFEEGWFGFVPGGYARVLCTYEQRLRELGVQLCPNSEVTTVQRTRDQMLSVRLSSGEEPCFEEVVVTAPTHIASKLCPDLAVDEKAALERVAYSGIVCTSVLLNRPISGCYVTNILDQSFSITGVIEMSALVGPESFGDRHLVYVPRYLRSDHEDFQRPDDKLASEAVSVLKRMYSSLKDDDFVAVRVARSKHVFARPAIGKSEELPRQTSVSGLTLVNSAHIENGTLNADETIQLAQAEVKRLNAKYN
jgi:protoporphyrinogen oxidase